MSQHPLNLALRFGLELAMLAAYGLWGWRAWTGPLRFVLALGLPLLAAVVWGAFVSPKAAVQLPGSVRLAIEAALFAGAIWAAYAAGVPAAAAIFGALVIVHQIASYDRLAAL
ncbi:MAG TPA: YrdB family protein [Roseiflexaceae bacterium]|nr:YrdB family protein [Roseiflexaceae bacterium]